MRVLQVYLSNHLPHALISLWHLGASTRRLLAYAAFYSTRLEPPRPHETDQPALDGQEAERRLGNSWQHEQQDEQGEEERRQGKAAASEDDRSSRNSQRRRGEREKRSRQPITVDRLLSSNWELYKGHKKHFRSATEAIPARAARRCPSLLVPSSSLDRCCCALLSSLPLFLFCLSRAYFGFFADQLKALQTEHEQQQQQPQPPQAEVEQVAGAALSVSEQYAVRQLLQQYAPILLPGASHSALHPLIHLGWSLSCGRAGLSTLCEGLAYLCYAYHSLDPPNASYSDAALAAVDGSDSLSLFAALRSTVSACRELHLLPAMEAGVLCVPYCEMNVGAFQRKLVWLSIQQPQLLHRLSCLPRLHSPSSHGLSDSLLPSLFLHTLFLFAVSGDDFFVLHCLTSLYALSRLLPWLPSHYQPTAVRYGLKYVLASWIAQGLPGVEDEVWSRGGQSVEQAVEWLLSQARQGDEAGSGRRLYEEVSWDELRSAAVDSDDEHTLKLVHVCFERSGSADASMLEQQLAQFVAWKRLTDEDQRLFAHSR